MSELAVLGGSPVRTTPFPAWPQPSPAVDTALLEVARSGHWWQSGGGAAERLESTLAEWFGVHRAIAVANGTVALELGLRALGVGPGDEVLVPATTFVSTAAAVQTIGAVPVPVDVHAATLNLDVDAAAPSTRTKALIVVHLAGQPADLAAARRFCDRHGLALLEDSAQAVTAEWAGVRVGHVGDITTLSFQAAKLLPGGDGGAVLIRTDPAVAEQVERSANCGRPRGSGSYAHVLPATNGRISEFAAAVVAAQIPGHETHARRRTEAAARMIEALPAGAVLSPDHRVSRHDWYMALALVPDELAERGLDNRTLAAALSAEGIPATVMYPTWSDLATMASVIDERAQLCVNSRAATGQVIWMHHRLLLDKGFSDDLAEAWAKISTHAGTLSVL